MRPMVHKKRALYFISFAVVFIVVIPFIILYSLGYRFTKEYGLDERGGIYVFVSEPGSQIFIDDTLEKVTGTFQKELFLQNLKPQSYRVLVSHEDFWPWAKEVDVYEREVSALFPFLVPKDIVMRDIIQATTTAITTKTATLVHTKSEYEKVLEFFTSPIVVGATAPATAPATTSATSTIGARERKNMRIWTEGNQVFAEWMGSSDRTPPYFCKVRVCEPLLVVFSAADEIRSVDFYPGREDAVIISVRDGIFALEIDTRTYHNFYPLYKGVTPEVRVEDGEVYVKDGTFFVELIDL